MLDDHDCFAMAAVTNLARARQFYEGVVGLAPTRVAETMASYRTGATRLSIYVSEYAGTNRANSCYWGVGAALGDIVAALTAKGVVFERYDLPDAAFRDGIHWFGDFGAAWFKDPDGNILHVNSGG